MNTTKPSKIVRKTAIVGKLFWVRSGPRETKLETENSFDRMSECDTSRGLLFMSSLGMSALRVNAPIISRVISFPFVLDENENICLNVYFKTWSNFSGSIVGHLERRRNVKWI